MKYPLSERELKVLTDNITLSASFILVGGMILAFIFTGIESGNWFWAFMQFGWANEVLGALLGPHFASGLLCALIVGACMLGFGQLAETIALRTKGALREEVYRLRQDLSGEIPRLPASTLFAILPISAFSEELLFRYGVIGILFIFFPDWMGFQAALVLAVVISSLIFMLVHEQYRSPYSMGIVFVLGCALAGVYLYSGSIIASAICHAFYNLSDVFLERRQMMRDPDYFAGKIPDNIVCDIMDEIYNERNL